jgi:hypothetical protein
MKPTTAKPRGKTPEPAESGPPTAASVISASTVHIRPDTLPDSGVALPNLPSFADALIARNAVLPQSAAAAAAVEIHRGVAFWDLGFPYWNEEQFYNLVMFELSPQGRYIIMRSELRTTRDLVELLEVVEPTHSLITILKVAHGTWGGVVRNSGEEAYGWAGSPHNTRGKLEGMQTIRTLMQIGVWFRCEILLLPAIPEGRGKNAPNTITQPITMLLATVHHITSMVAGVAETDTAVRNGSYVIHFVGVVASVRAK